MLKRKSLHVDYQEPMKVYLLFFLTGVLSFYTLAQDISVFEGAYMFKGKSGEATFTFIPGQDEEVLLHGPFLFERKEVDSLNQTSLVKFSVKGEYRDNNREGSWFFDQERHKVTLEDVVSFEIIAQLESSDLEITANYQDGLPNGLWQLRENEFSNNTKKLKAVAEDIRFEDGVIKGPISYRRFLGEYTQFLRGKTNAEGFMDGEWSLVYVQDSVLVSEVRKYDNGFLLGIVRRDLGSGEGIDEAVYYGTIEKLQQVNNGENDRFQISEKKFEFDYNDGYRQEAPERRIQVVGNAFINNFLKDLLRFDDAVNSTGEIRRFPFFTKRFEYTLADSEREMLVEIPVLYDQLRDSVSRFATMNSLSLNRSKSDSLAFSYAFFSSRAAGLLKMEDFVNLLRTGDIKHYDLANFTRDGVEFIPIGNELTYVYQRDTIQRSLPLNTSDALSSTFLTQLKTYLQGELHLVEKFGAFVDRELYAIEMNSRLAALEETIIRRRAELEEFVRNYQPEGEREWVFIDGFEKQFLDKKFGEISEKYAEIEDLERKLDQGTVLLDLLDEVETQLPVIATLFERQRALDEVYMEEMFNPFTYSRYDQRAKERLYKAGEVLFQYYIDQLKKENDYTQIKDHITTIEKFQNKMYVLREHDTRSLERKLGKRKSPSRIEGALGL